MDTQQSLNLVTDVFKTILGVSGRPFGGTSKTYDGMSDDAEGVQWNVATFKDKPQRARVGVNLEGMKYKDWPIARFIESELKNRALLSLPVEKDKIYVGFFRDAWQVTNRPAIEERSLGCSGISLEEMTGFQWKKTLDEAYACLDPQNNHRGRAKQDVTLSKSGMLKTMEVSPHLQIYTTIWSIFPADFQTAKTLMQKSFDRLMPVYEYVRGCIE
jgi:hypothetical protein